MASRPRAATSGGGTRSSSGRGLPPSEECPPRVRISSLCRPRTSAGISTIGQRDRFSENSSVSRHAISGTRCRGLPARLSMVNEVVASTGAGRSVRRLFAKFRENSRGSVNSQSGNAPGIPATSIRRRPDSQRRSSVAMPDTALPVGRIRCRLVQRPSATASSWSCRYFGVGRVVGPDHPERSLPRFEIEGVYRRSNGPARCRLPW
jgi:hypothetical protein